MPDVPNPLTAAGPDSSQLYTALLKAIKPLGPFREEVKKTFIHLVRKSAFAGVHPRKANLIVTIKSATPIASARIAKSEQVSKSRWHIDIKLTATSDIDAQLLGLREAYVLCA